MQATLVLPGGRACAVPRHVVQARQLHLRPTCLVPRLARGSRCCGGRLATWLRPAADGIRTRAFNVQAEISEGAVDDLSNWRDWLKGPEDPSAATALSSSTSSLPAVTEVVPGPETAAEQAGSTTLLPDWLDAATQPPSVPVQAPSKLPGWLANPLEASSSNTGAAEAAAAATADQGPSAASAAAEELSKVPLAVVQAPSTASEQALTAATPPNPFSSWLQGAGETAADSSSAAVGGDAAAGSSSTPWNAWLQAPADAAASTNDAAAAADKAGSFAAGWFKAPAGSAPLDAPAEAATSSTTGGLSDWMAGATEQAASASTAAAKEAVAVRNPFAGWLPGGASSSGADAAAAAASSSSSSAMDAVSAAHSSAASDMVQGAVGDASGAAAEGVLGGAQLQLPSFTAPDLSAVPEQLKALPFKLPAAAPGFEFKLPQLPADFPHLPEALQQLQVPDHLPSGADLLPGGLGALLETRLPLPDISLPMAGAAAAAGGASSALAGLLGEGGAPWVQAVGIVGFLLGALGLSLYTLEAGARQQLAADVEELKAGLAAKEEELQQLTTELEQEKKARAEAESWLPRLKDAEKDIFKLERALELKDGQLETFITTAHRQIKLLEQRIKDQQKMPR